jgi:hypothetical protein
MSVHIRVLTHWVLPVIVVIHLLASSVSSLGSCAGFSKPINSSFPYGFMIDFDNSPTWSDALLYSCQFVHPDASLAILRDKDAFDVTLTILNSIADTAAWIAVNQTDGSQGIYANWQWSDGVPLNGNSQNSRYFQWGPYEPNESPGQDLCAVLWPGFWAVLDVPCEWTNPSGCEVHGELLHFSECRVQTVPFRRKLFR